MGNREPRSPSRVLLALVVALVSAVTGRAEDPDARIGHAPSPAELRARPVSRAHLRRALDKRHVGSLASVSSSGSLPDVYRKFTRIAYQTWVNHNWEIYAAWGDGSEPTRLTHHSADDEAPSFADGCGLIAFSTTRNGNDDIYTMHADGSNVRLLTIDPADEVLPALSPDATHVAFQSYCDGDQPEIYVMEATGGTATRLTHNDDYDGQPDWSPDGLQIAFISDRSGTKNVWLMDANGSNARQVTALAHAGGPKWSPNAEYITFASDDLGTGFTSLWVVSADGSDPHLIWRPSGSQSDAWPGAWSFDSNYILYEEAAWDYDEDWYIVSSYLDVISPQDHTRCRLLDSGVNMAGSWALCDTTAPSSQVDPLPIASESPATTSWSGDDDWATELEYQLQYRIGGIVSWVDWQVTPGSTWTAESQGTFVWEYPGAVVYFRCRARDPVGNVEPWPAGPGDAYTSFPAHISGFVGDCREIPVAEATLSGPPPLTPTSLAGIDGRYLLLASGEGKRALGVAAEGYNPLQLSRPALDHMDEINHYLCTEPELTDNGGFEAGHAAWYSTGGTTFVTGDYGYGSTFAKLGIASATSSALEPVWTLPRTYAIWQVVEVPLDTHEPTLSFMYVLGNGTGGPVGTLQALIAADDEETAVADADTATEWVSIDEGTRYPLWQHAYADLTPWTGSTITVTLRYDAGWTNSYALLDQVSIAAWLTPLVNEVEPRRSTPGETTTLTIHGANFVQGSPLSAQALLGPYELNTTYVSSTTLEATLPHTLPGGTYDVWVRNPSGHRGGLADAFAVTGLLAIPLIQKNVSHGG